MNIPPVSSSARAGMARAMNALDAGAQAVASASAPAADFVQALQGAATSPSVAPDAVQTDMIDAQVTVLAAQHAMQVNATTLRTAHQMYEQAIGLIGE